MPKKAKILDYTGLVLTFSSRATATSGSGIHDKNCHIAKRDSRGFQVIDEDVEAYVSDLIERGYKVKVHDCVSDRKVER